MTGRAAASRFDPGTTLPEFERSAPPPSPALLAARIEAHTGPGDVVADLAGRGGWVARAAIDHQRRAVSIESTPLNRMLAEVVLRPPDVRHLDAAFQGLAASPRRESSLKVSIGDLFATRCPTCGRMLVADEILWSTEGTAGAGKTDAATSADDADGVGDGAPTVVAAQPVLRQFRCTVCRDQRGGSESRQAPLDDDDRVRALARADYDEARATIADRFPPVEGAPTLVDELLDLHTPRQLIGLSAILQLIEGDLRAAPVLASLRLALLHAILPASRLGTTGGRHSALRVAGGHVRLPSNTQWRERNPWLTFEDGLRLVRGFVHRLEGGAMGPMPARLGEDLRALGEGSATAVLAVASPSAVRALRDERPVYERTTAAPRVRLVLGQPPVRPSLERLGAAYHATAWMLGREAAALLPIDALAGSSLRAPWSWQAVAMSRALSAVEPSMARDGRVVQFVDGGPEALASMALGAAYAGYRTVVARLADPEDAAPGSIEFVPPGATVPPGPRTRANQGLPAVPGGAGDPDLVPGPGLFAPPERYDQRPADPAEAARVVTDVAVDTLRARGEPARFERLFGEILVGLDRSGQLRRYAARSQPGTDPADHVEPSHPTTEGEASDDHGPFGDDEPAAGSAWSPPTGGIRSAGHARTAGPETAPPATTDRGTATRDAAPDPVEALLALIRDELARPTQRRLVEIEPGRWWLGERADEETAAPPLADRVEWAVFSLLSTAGPLSEPAFYERMATMFTGHDLPDETLIRACLDSYRGAESTTGRLTTDDDLLRRSQQHAELLAQITDAGHRLGMRVWLSPREQGRKFGAGTLGDRLDPREREASLSGLTRAGDALAEVDALWYVRGKIGIVFEVEWTAILGETLLRRHVRIPPDERLIRFLAIAPERTELVRHKLERSPLLRSAMDQGAWNLIKWDHLRTFLSGDPPDLATLEPLLGLDPVVERRGEQLPLFNG